MTLDDAIRAHVTWKIRLQSYLSGHGEKFDAAKVAQDCNCDHAAFHVCASRVIVASDRGTRRAPAPCCRASSRSAPPASSWPSPR